MKKYILFVIYATLIILPPMAYSAPHNAMPTIEYSAKEYYDLIYIQHVREPNTRMLKFAEKENTIVRGVIARRGYCVPKPENLKLVYYLFHIGVGFIEERQRSPFIATRQYETFTAHEVIEVGLYYTQYINCE